MPTEEKVTVPQRLQGKIRDFLELVPSQEVIFLKPGQREGRPLAPTSDPGTLSREGIQQCWATLHKDWFISTAAELRVIMHADNLCSMQSAANLIPANTTHDVRRVAIASLCPFDGKSTGPLGFDLFLIERAIDGLVTALNDEDVQARLAPLPEEEGAAEAWAALDPNDQVRIAMLPASNSLVVVTQMGFEPNAGLELPFMIARALNLHAKVSTRDRAYGPCQGMHLSLPKHTVEPCL